jgi:hypothetical protein
MATQPSRIARLFARREIILSAPVPHKRSQDPSEMSGREFRVLRHLLALDEPTRFELAEANFIETSYEPYHEYNKMTKYMHKEAHPGS